MWLLWYTLMLFFLRTLGKVAGFPLIQCQHMTDFSSTSIISSVNTHVHLQYNNFCLGCRGIVNTVCAVSVYRVVCSSIPSIVHLSAHHSPLCSVASVTLYGGGGPRALSEGTGVPGRPLEGVGEAGGSSESEFSCERSSTRALRPPRTERGSGARLRKKDRDIKERTDMQNENVHWWMILYNLSSIQKSRAKGARKEIPTIDLYAITAGNQSLQALELSNKRWLSVHEPLYNQISFSNATSKQSQSLS